ncbi:MAG: glycine cleavage system protein H [Planctomycetales bacterium]|nr:glycine cleavage system protein H [Planctomycetales bacterium]
MSEPHVFMMGEFAAEVPSDRQYARNHMWASGDVQILRFGFTSYAVRLLQDVYFLDWTVAAGTVLRQRQEMGAIESKKAESDLFSPVSGELRRFNEILLSDPSTINVDKYGAGWLFEMEFQPQEGDTELLSPSEYVDHLHAVWEVTQRTIKGQLN